MKVSNSNIKCFQSAAFLMTTWLVGKRLVKHLPNSNSYGVFATGFFGTALSAIPNNRKYKHMKIWTGSFYRRPLENILDTALSLTVGSSLTLVLSKLFPQKITLSAQGALKFSAIPLATSLLTSSFLVLSDAEFLNQYEELKIKEYIWNDFPAEKQSKLAKKYFEKGMPPGLFWSLKPEFSASEFLPLKSFNEANQAELDWYTLMQRNKLLTLSTEEFLTLLEQGTDKKCFFPPILTQANIDAVKGDSSLGNRMKTFIKKDPQRLITSDKGLRDTLIQYFYPPNKNWQRASKETFEEYYTLMLKKVLIMTPEQQFKFNTAAKYRKGDFDKDYTHWFPENFQEYIDYATDYHNRIRLFYQTIEEDPKLVEGLSSDIIDKLRELFKRQAPLSFLDE